MSDTTIPKGSLVLVTGANGKSNYLSSQFLCFRLHYTGYIASHIVDALLAQGYQVRGTARSASKLDGLKEVWAKKYPKAHFEVVVVEDMAKDGAFDDAVKGSYAYFHLVFPNSNWILECSGVSGVIHPASVVAFSPVPEEVIDPTVGGTLTLLRSAATQPSITRFVLTSSAAAGDFPRPNEVYSVGENSWNEVSVQGAYQEGPMQGMNVYCASKVLGEKAAWKFVQEEKPGFVLNTIIPNYNVGPILDPKTQSGSSAGMFKAAFEQEDFGFIVAVPRESSSSSYLIRTHTFLRMVRRRPRHSRSSRLGAHLLKTCLTWLPNLGRRTALHT